MYIKITDFAMDSRSFTQTLRYMVFKHCYCIQVSSLYKMRSPFFVPIPSIEGSTWPNWMKFCMGPPKGVTRVMTEGFLNIRSRGLDLGCSRGLGGGPKTLKNIFSIF